MNIEKFLNELKRLIEELEAVTCKVVNNVNEGMNEIPKVMKDINELLPDWFWFIEQTGIGDKQEVVQMMSEVVDGIERQDGVWLTDVLFYGVRELMFAYKNVIEEALDGE